MRSSAFVDESLRDARPGVVGYYQLTAVVVDRKAVPSCRADMTQMAPQGFKASARSAAGDKLAVTEMLKHIESATGWNFITVTTTAGKNLEPARQACLAELLDQLNRQSVQLVVADSREAILGADREARNKRDLATFQGLKQAGQLDHAMRLLHQHDSHEPMLYMPDAVGWAYRQFSLRGDDTYWGLVSSVTTVTEI